MGLLTSAITLAITQTIQEETVQIFQDAHLAQEMGLKDVANASQDSTKIQEEPVSVAMFQTANLVECRMFAINVMKTIKVSVFQFLVINVFYVIKLQLALDV
jgi:hypothetical protein